MGSGKVETDEEGDFEITVFLKPDNQWRNVNDRHSRYTVNALFTDKAGEAQMGHLEISANKNSLRLFTNIGRDIQKEDTSTVTFYARNHYLHPIDTTGQYTIAGVTRENYKYIAGETLLTSDFIFNQPTNITSLRSLPSGR